MELFYNDINKKRDSKMRWQTDQEFKQRKIFGLNKKINVEKYSTNLRGGKAFAAEEKIRELRKTLLRSKCMEKFKGKRIRSNELIKTATFNLNNTWSAKCGYSPPTNSRTGIRFKTEKILSRSLRFWSANES